MMDSAAQECADNDKERKPEGLTRTKDPHEGWTGQNLFACTMWTE